MPLPHTYMDIVNDITRKIESGELPAGSALPPYREIAQEYDVGITTASRAIALLRERGLVVGIAGKGVYVAE